LSSSVNLCHTNHINTEHLLSSSYYIGYTKYAIHAENEEILSLLSLASTNDKLYINTATTRYWQTTND